jgi:hypothetical protein
MKKKQALRALEELTADKINDISLTTWNKILDEYIIKIDSLENKERLQV